MDIALRIITDTTEAEQIWKTLSPNEGIYDTWEFRFCFHKYYQYKLHFIVGFNGSEPVGVLPLQYNSDKNCYEFFGTYFMETNRVFVKPGYESTVPQYYDQIPTPANLESISAQDEFTNNFPIQDYKYVLQLAKYKDFEDYVAQAFSSKSRSGLHKKIRAIEAMGQLTWEENNFADIELLFKFNIESFDDKFAEKGGRRSSFLYQYRQEIYRDFLTLPFDPYVLTLKINGAIQAVSLTLRYKGQYVFLNTGANLRDIPNLGTYMYYQNIKRAFEQKMSAFDAGTESYGWKERFHLEPTPQHHYVK